MPDYCNVHDCPGREKCLELEDPRHCALYRLAQGNPVICKDRGYADRIADAPRPRPEKKHIGEWPDRKRGPEYRYQFPAIAESVTHRRQLIKLKEELAEVEDEALEVRFGRAGKKGLKRLAMELLNVVHACETWLRYIDLTGEEIEALRQAVETDNRERGYYDGV